MIPQIKKLSIDFKINTKNDMKYSLHFGETHPIMQGTLHRLNAYAVIVSST